MNNNIQTYGEARQAAFRRLVLEQRIKALQLRERALLAAEDRRALRLIREDLQRHLVALATGADLVEVLAPGFRSWAA